jgi:SprT protein
MHGNLLVRMVNQQLLESATRETQRLIERAQCHYGVILALGEIRYDLQGTAAGMVMFPHNRQAIIRFNPLLLEHNRQDFISQTVAHEVAHLVARTLYGKSIRPHGREWQAVMHFFGVEPQRCHDYATEHLSVRKMRRFPYVCGCQTHQLSTIRHNRIQKGQDYCCRRCGEALRYLEV